MSTDIDLDCPKPLHELAIEFHEDGRVSVRVAAPILQILNVLTIATRSLDDILHPGRRNKPTLSEVMTVRKELVPELTSFAPFSKE